MVPYTAPTPIPALTTATSGGAGASPAQDGIRANCVLPGWVDTPLTRQGRRDIPDLDRRVRERTPIGRWAEPEEISGAILFLASPAARFITGTAIPVDGGYLVRG
jgi:2-deoxy-D-gluconate 3-dehydrogenase